MFTMSCSERGLHSPSLYPSWYTNHAMTPTCQELPTNVSRMSFQLSPFWFCLHTHGRVYPTGIPTQASLSEMFGNLPVPFLFHRR